MVVMEGMGTPIGSYAPDFEVPGVDDRVHHLARYMEKHQVIGVVFMGNQCPYVAELLEALKQLQQEVQTQGVTFVGMNANQGSENSGESFEQMKEFAQEHQLNFPYLRDVTQDVAQCFGVTQTPEVFLLNHEGKLCYRRGITEEEGAVEQWIEDIRGAIAQILQGEEVTYPIPKVLVGTAIQWRS